MSHNEIDLFVMPGCSICPKMEHLFNDMLQKEQISRLKIYDVTEHPDLARQYHIRSVPYYRINGVAFTGLKTHAEIRALLDQGSSANWIDRISEELSQGNLDEIEQGVRDDSVSREAMLALLEDDQAPLVVRIGLTAIIESVAASGLLNGFESRFIQLAQRPDPRIATDGLYYLYLLSTPGSLAALEKIADSGHPEELRAEAAELLLENLSESWSS